MPTQNRALTGKNPPGSKGQNFYAAIATQVTKTWLCNVPYLLQYRSRGFYFMIKLPARLIRLLIEYISA